MIITSDQFNDAYAKLPYVLREYIAEDDLTAVTEAVGQEYGLHVDTQGALYRETTNMLLGIINPTQFVGELKSVGIPEASIGPIVQELNEKIFIPLREKMKNQPGEPERDEEEYEPEQSATPSPAPTPATAPAYVAPPAPVMPPVTPPYEQIAPAFVPPPAPSVAYLPQAPIAQPAPSYIPPAPPAPVNLPTFTPDVPPVPPAPVHMYAPPAMPANIPAPHARTMEEDMREAEIAQQRNPNLYGLQPEQHSPAMQSFPPPQQFTPAPSAPAQFQSIPRPQPASPASAPVPPAPIPTAPLSSVPAYQEPSNRDALHEVLKGYGIDPYREVPE